jgi:hypothetical protein
MVSRGVITHLVALAAIGWTVVFAQSAQRLEGTVVVDKKQPVAVHDLQMDFRPTGAGYYDSSLYGKRRAIPLDNGINASFDRITEARFTCRGDAGRGAVVQVILRTTTGQAVEGTLAGPGGAVFLVGTTELGAFELRVNPFGESRDTVVTFRR